MRKAVFFIIGAGRSGTGLLLRILRDHSEIWSPKGELNAIWHPKLYPYSKRRVDGPMYQEDPFGFTELSRRSRGILGQLRMDCTVASARLRPGYPLFKSPMLTFAGAELYCRYRNVRFISISRERQKVINSWVAKDYKVKHASTMSEANYRIILDSYISETERLLENSFFRRLSQKGHYHAINFENFIKFPEANLDRLTEFMQLKSNLHIPGDVSIDTSR